MRSTDMGLSRQMFFRGPQRSGPKRNSVPTRANTGTADMHSPLHAALV